MPTKLHSQVSDLHMTELHSQSKSEWLTKYFGNENVHATLDYGQRSLATVPED